MKKLDLARYFTQEIEIEKYSPTEPYSWLVRYCGGVAMAECHTYYHLDKIPRDVQFLSGATQIYYNTPSGRYKFILEATPSVMTVITLDVVCNGDRVIEKFPNFGERISTRAEAFIDEKKKGLEIWNPNEEKQAKWKKEEEEARRGQ